MMGSSSFISPRQPRFAPGELCVWWYEHPTGDAYVVNLGPDVSMQVLPDDARELVTKLTAAMAERGEAVELPDETPADAVALDNAAADLAEITREVEFLYPTQDLGPRLRTILARLGYVAEPTIDAAEDYAVDRERDRVVGL